jgi:colanic acid biosynthesis glycosyl transferase WcaI
VARLLIVSINYAPEATGIGPYVAGAARALAASGHEVHVLTGLPHYPEWRVRRGTRRSLRWHEMDGTVTVHRRAHYVPARQSALRRAAYEGTFLLQAMLGPPDPIDAVIGVIPALADGALARLIAMRHRVPYGLIFQDLMGQAADQSGIEGGGGVATIARRLESWSVARAALVGMITPSFRPYLESLGLRPGRLVNLQNWTRARAPSGARDETRSSLGWGRELVVLHTGNIGLKQGLEQVVEAAALVSLSGAAIRFVIVGAGNQRERIAALGAGLSALEMHPLVAEDDLADLLAAADVLLVSEKASVVDMSLPSKLTSYLAAGRPIVAAIPLEGATAREIRRSGGGIVVPAGDPKTLVDTLIRLAADPGLMARLGQTGARFAQLELDEETALNRYRSFVDQILTTSALGGAR